MAFRNNGSRRALILAGSILFAMQAARAGSVWTVSGIASGASQFRQPGQVGTCSYSGTGSGNCSYVNNSGPLPYNSTDSQVWTSTIASYSASLSSSGDANGLHALAAVSITNDPLDFQHYWMSDPGDGAAYATWTDTLTINGPNPAYMVLMFAIDGLLSASSHARADTTVDWSAYVVGVQSYSNSWIFSTLGAIGPPVPGTPLTAAKMLVNPGDSVQISLRLGAKAYVGCQMFSTPLLCTASATADMSNTLAFSSIGFQDGGGNYLPGFSIGSSNFDYNSFNPLGGGGSAPEPGTAVLAGASLILLATAGRRRLAPVRSWVVRR